jgi:putative membrane protein
MKLLLHWLVAALVIIGISYFGIIPGVTVLGFVPAFFAAVLLGFMSAVVKPILGVVTLPLTILTLGLFSFVVNALLILLVAYLVPGFDVSGFVPALILSLVLALVHLVFKLKS